VRIVAKKAVKKAVVKKAEKPAEADRVGPFVCVPV
jgi:hypothetical protein